MTKGLRITPRCCRIREAAHGSSSQASTPSVIKMMTLRQSAHSGKSLPALIRLRAIGVVPIGRSPASVFWMRGIEVGLKATSSRVSLQSWGGTGFWCPYTRSASSKLGCSTRPRLSSSSRIRRWATSMRVPVCHRPYMEFDASNTNKMRVSGSGFFSGGGSTPCAQAPKELASKRSASSPRRSISGGLSSRRGFRGTVPGRGRARRRWALRRATCGFRP